MNGLKLFFTVILLITGTRAFAQVGIGTTSPSSSAALDVTSAEKGLLIPRIALNASNVAAPVASPASGLLVYNTAYAGVSPHIVCPGLYMWSGRTWIRLDNGMDCGNESPLPDNCDPDHSITDIDGNVYPTVIIGTQEWMARNLKVSHYRNSDPIPNVTDQEEWGTLSTGAYCWYTNDSAYFEPLYGKLYNWFAVTDSRNLCPAGWHVPSDDELTILTDFINPGTLVGTSGPMKETGTLHWASPNAGATNATCFTAIAGGCRNYWDAAAHGAFGYFNYICWLWSGTTDTGDATRAWFRTLGYDNPNGYRNSVDKRQANTVRCLRD
jgi:uncharacterized protein (TIGR02145 family)